MLNNLKTMEMVSIMNKQEKSCVHYQLLPDWYQELYCIAANISK